MSELKQTLDNTQGNYSGIFSFTSRTYWAAESTSERITCNRKWVQDWEWFSIIDDKFSGKKLIQSDYTGKFVEVREDGSLYASQTNPVINAQFDINYTDGTIKSVFNKRYVSMQNGDVRADSYSPVFLTFFDLHTVAIADPELIVYATPNTFEGKPAIIFNSKQPYQFVLITTKDGKTSYLQTKAYEYLKPINSVDPVIYVKDSLNNSNYRFKITPVPNKINLYTIMAGDDSINKYCKLEEKNVNGEKSLVLYSSADDASAPLSEFNIVLTR